MKKLLKKPGVQALVASFICILLGLLVGYVALLIINPEGASEAMVAIVKNFLTAKKTARKLKLLGNTLAKTMPLIMCSLSILFAYKVGLFNIGAAGQYVVGACASLYAALAWGWNWWLCVILAMVCGAVYGAIVGLLKSYCNVNEVISGIMLNWIALYSTNTILTLVKETTSPYTMYIDKTNPSAILPTLGLDKLLGSDYVTIAIPAAIIIAIVVEVILSKTKFGYELRATGNNKNAAKYAGMAENRNIIVTLAISGALAALGAAMLYLCGYMRWECTQSSVPGMGFNGIAAAFLGGLNPIGAIFSSFFIQHITDGGVYVNTNFYCSQISDLISSVIIYLCGFVLFIKLQMNSIIAKREEQAKKKLADSKEGGDK